MADADEVVLEAEVTNKGALALYQNLGFLRDKRLLRSAEAVLMSASFSEGPYTAAWDGMVPADHQEQSCPRQVTLGLFGSFLPAEGWSCLQVLPEWRGRVPPEAAAATLTAAPGGAHCQAVDQPGSSAEPSAGLRGWLAGAGSVS